MAPRAKQQLFHSLAQLLRAGITFPHALDKLARTTRGPARKAVARIRRELEKGKTVAEACAAADLGSTEAAVLTAVERTGSLDRGLEQLAEYFGAIASARGRIAAKLAYPIFVLVLAAVLLNLPILIQRGSAAYLQAAISGSAWVAGVVLLGVIIAVLASLARTSTTAEILLGTVPFSGTRRRFVMSRFCMVYDLQLAAGINTFAALAAAGEASQSALVKARVARILPEIRAGSQVGPLLAQTGAFSPEVSEAVMVGEETGSLGVELQRVAALERERGFQALERLSEWLPRLFYVAVLIFVGVKIVSVFQDYLGLIQSIGIE